MTFAYSSARRLAIRSRIVGVAFGFMLAAPSAVRAEEKATLMDHVDQIIATFMGDPAANVDIDMKHVLDWWRGMHPKPLNQCTIEEARRQPTPIEAAVQVLHKQGKTLDTFAITQRAMTFPAADGSRLSATIFTPDGVSATPRPIVVFYHSGGFVLDSKLGTEASARAIAGRTGAIVVAPDYRLAPEHKFPQAQEDALAAYRWALSPDAGVGGDPSRIALAGEGAGGMLAVDTAISARTLKLQKAAALVLIVPAAGTDLKTNSWLQDSAARPWNDKAVAWALKLFLPKPEDRNSPQIDIIGKADVDGLPPTTIVTAEIDPLRSDGERLGGKLARAVVPVAMRDYPGVTHDFFGMGAAVERAEQAEAFVAERIKTAFAPPDFQASILENMGIAPYRLAPDPVTAPAYLAVPGNTQKVP